MAGIAVECLRHSRRNAVWRRNLANMCARRPTDHLNRHSIDAPLSGPPSKRNSNLCLPACGVTVLFVLLCVTLALVAGRDPPSLTTEIIRGLFSLAQIGFGAVAGLLVTLHYDFDRLKRAGKPGKPPHPGTSQGFHSLRKSHKGKVIVMPHWCCTMEALADCNRHELNAMHQLSESDRSATMPAA